MEQLFAQFDAYMHFTPEIQAEITAFCKQITVPKGAMLLREGVTCDTFYFIKSGLLRGYSLHKGNEITRWFSKENDVATSMYSLIQQKPSYECIEALESSVLISFSNNSMQSIISRYPFIGIVGMRMVELAFIELEEHLHSMQYLSATERYKRFVEKHPDIARRAPLGHIASYLGIRQETLSRIRAKE